MTIHARILFKSALMPEIYVRQAVWDDDPQLVELIKEVMPSNGMMLSFERFPSYLKAIRIQSNKTQSVVVVDATQPQKILGMFLFAWKDYYINHELKSICYICDLRMVAALRGKRIIRYLMDFLKSQFPENTIYQSVILADNQLALNIFHIERPDYLRPFQYDNIYTYSVSHVKKVTQHAELNVIALTEEWLRPLQQFLKHMQAHYNFLPNYKFSDLLSHTHYWGDLNLKDFHVVLDRQKQIVGLYGLWDQKKIKQIRVVKYDKKMLLFRPLHNLYAQFRGGFMLPKTQGVFDYLLVHSPICAPTRLDVFQTILAHAMQQTKMKQQKVFSLTLAENDPRRAVLTQVRTEIMQAKHAFHSFSANPIEQFDRSKISYIDLCRI